MACYIPALLLRLLRKGYCEHRDPISKEAYSQAGDGLCGLRFATHTGRNR